MNRTNKDELYKLKGPLNDYMGPLMKVLNTTQPQFWRYILCVNLSPLDLFRPSITRPITHGEHTSAHLLQLSPQLASMCLDLTPKTNDSAIKWRVILMPITDSGLYLHLDFGRVI